MKKILAGLLVSSLVVLSATTNKEIKMEAKQALMKMGGALKSNMKKNMKEGGPVQAAHFCSDEAVNIEKEVNKTYRDGVSVKRISLKYRNEDNAPNADEAVVLKELQATMDAHKPLPKLLVKKVGENKYKVYKPLVIKKDVCLACHGILPVRSEEAYKIIKSKYPHDKAIDYKKGDLRGAFVVEMTK